MQKRKSFIIRYLRKVYLLTFKVITKLFVNLFHPSQYLISSREKREVSQSFQRRILLIYSVSEIVHIAHVYHIFSQCHIKVHRERHRDLTEEFTPPQSSHQTLLSSIADLSGRAMTPSGFLLFSLP